MIPASCTVSWTFVHSSSGTLLDLISWIYLSLPLYNCKGFDLGHTRWSSGFPYFLQFKSEFGNKEFMFWATVSSQSCFCWLYRVSPSLAAKNIINLFSVLTIWWCPSLRRNEVAIMVNKSPKRSTWMQSQKWQNDLFVFTANHSISQ